MKISIGTPIHISQDSAIKKWLRSVSKLEYPADLFMVDTSPSMNYIEKVKGYCKKYGIENYRIEHLKICQEQPEGERLGRSREKIRQEVIVKNYDAWLNWECNYFLRPDALEKLITIMQAGGYSVVSHISGLKKISLEPNRLFGVDLIKRDTLFRYGFLVEYPDMPNIWYGNGLWFKKRVARDGGKLVELDIENSSHFNEYKDKAGLKLNLGCGKKHLQGYVNIDIQYPCDLKHDLRDPLPFKDNSVDEIFSEGNVISLFSREEWKKLKKEIARILKPGGKLKIVFLDFEYILKAFLNNKDGQRWSWWIETIFSGQQNGHEFSKNGFTSDKLISDFAEEGIKKFSIKRLSKLEHIVFVGFKKILFLILVFILFIPRVMWANLAYLAADLTSDEDDGPPAYFLTTLIKKKKKMSSPAFFIEISQLQL